MRNTSAKREALHSWLDRLDDAGVDRLFLVMREMDTNLRHQPAPAGWIPLHQVAEQLGRDRRHLTRSCPAWAALGQARKFLRGRQLAWHLSADLAESLGATPRNGCATRGVISADTAQNVRTGDASLQSPLDAASSPVLTASDRTSAPAGNLQTSPDIRPDQPPICNLAGIAPDRT